MIQPNVNNDKNFIIRVRKFIIQAVFIIISFVKLCTIKATPFTLKVGDIKNVEWFENSGCQSFYCEIRERTNVNITNKLTMREFLQFYFQFLMLFF